VNRNGGREMEELILLHDMYINGLITKEEVFPKLKAIFKSDRAVETILKKWEGENDKQN